MVALLDPYDDVTRGLPETHELPTGTECTAAAVRLEKISAACAAIALRRYDFDEEPLDVTAEAVHRTLTLVL